MSQCCIIGAVDTLISDMKNSGLHEEANELLELSDKLIFASTQYEMTAKLEKRLNKNTNQKEWALVSRRNPNKILKWFGTSKPTDEEVAIEEERVRYYVNLNKSTKVAAATQIELEAGLTDFASKLLNFVKSLSSKIKDWVKKNDFPTKEVQEQLFKGFGKAYKTYFDRILREVARSFVLNGGDIEDFGFKLVKDLWIVVVSAIKRLSIECTKILYEIWSRAKSEEFQSQARLEMQKLIDDHRTEIITVTANAAWIMFNKLFTKSTHEKSMVTVIKHIILPDLRNFANHAMLYVIEMVMQLVIDNNVPAAAGPQGSPAPLTFPLLDTKSMEEKYAPKADKIKKIRGLTTKALKKVPQEV